MHIYIPHSHTEESARCRKNKHLWRWRKQREIERERAKQKTQNRKQKKAGFNLPHIYKVDYHGLGWWFESLRVDTSQMLLLKRPVKAWWGATQPPSFHRLPPPRLLWFWAVFRCKHHYILSVCDTVCLACKMTSSYTGTSKKWWKHSASEIPPPLWHIRIYELVIPAGVIWLVQGPAVLRLGFYVRGKAGRQLTDWLYYSMFSSIFESKSAQESKRETCSPAGLRESRISLNQKIWYRQMGRLWRM